MLITMFYYHIKKLVLQDISHRSKMSINISSGTKILAKPQIYLKGTVFWRMTYSFLLFKLHMAVQYCHLC